MYQRLACNIHLNTEFQESLSQPQKKEKLPCRHTHRRGREDAKRKGRHARKTHKSNNKVDEDATT